MKFFILFIMFFAFQTKAGGFAAVIPKVTVKELCDQPVQVICGPSLSRTEAREAHVERLQEEVRTKAWSKVKTAMPDANWEELPFGVLVARKLTSRQQKIALLYFNEVHAQLISMVGESFSNLTPVFDNIRSLLKQTFTERLNANLPDDVKAMTEVLVKSNVQFFDALKILSSGAEIDPAALSAVIELCGKDGLTDNAYASQTENYKFVVICPGNYLGAYNEAHHVGLTKVEFADEQWLLGHELGHHIDASVFPRAYEKMQTCLADHYLSQLGEVDAQGNKASVTAKDLPMYMSEISADYWGGEVLIDLLKKEKTVKNKIAIVQNALAFLCNTIDDGTKSGHPDGKFRIETLLRRNPRFNEVMGCALPPADHELNASCTLRGEWPLRIW